MEEFCESNSRTRLIFLSPRLSTILPFFRFSPLSGSRLWILYRPRKRRSTINCFNQILQLNWIESSSSQLPEQRRPGGKETQTKDICPTGMTIMQCSLFDCVTSLFLKCTIYCFHLITNDLFTYRVSHIYCPIRLNGFRQGLWSISITCNWRFCMLILLSRLPLKFEIRNLWTLSSQSLARSRPANYLTTTTTMTSLSRRKTSKVFLCFLWPGLFLCWLHFDLSLPTLIQFCCHPGLVAPKFCYDYNFHLRWNSNVSPWVLP